MESGIGDLLIWGALSFALAIAGVAAFPVNRWLSTSGRGHAVLHNSGHHPNFPTRVVAIITATAFVFGSAVLIAEAVSFDDPDNILVEGTSDWTYLTVLSGQLRELGREALDERWRILPTGGAQNIPASVALLGRHVDVTVLVDAGTQGMQRLHGMAAKGLLAAGRLDTVAEVTGSRNADIDARNPGACGSMNHADGNRDAGRGRVETTSDTLLRWTDASG
jgi:hypothetical protein